MQKFNRTCFPLTILFFILSDEKCILLLPSVHNAMKKQWKLQALLHLFHICNCYGTVDVTQSMNFFRLSQEKKLCPCSVKWEKFLKNMEKHYVLCLLRVICSWFTQNVLTSKRWRTKNKKFISNHCLLKYRRICRHLPVFDSTCKALLSKRTGDTLKMIFSLWKIIFNVDKRKNCIIIPIRWKWIATNNKQSYSRCGQKPQKVMSELIWVTFQKRAGSL